MSNLQAQFPQVNAPFVDPGTGVINQQWYFLLLSLFNRTGGTTGQLPGGTSQPINSIVEYGGVGDGVTDNTAAFRSALAAENSVYLPPGNYKIQSSVILTNNQSILGAGQSSQITAATNSFDVIQIQGQFNQVSSVKLNNGNAGIRLFGQVGPCVQNNVVDVDIWNANYGLILDGFNNTNFPCYWNNFFRVLIMQPKTEGVWLTKSGAGDSPNANKFHSVRVYSHAAPMTGSGFHLQYARFNNSFIDCEANLYPSATACFRVGPGADTTQFINPYAESLGPLPNIWLEAGSQNTVIYNLLSASAGAAIYDQSGGQYQAYNSGYPIKNHLTSVLVNDITTNLQRFNTKFISGVSLLTVDLSTSYYLLSAFTGNMIVNLPAASAAGGCVLHLKRGDATANSITVVENNGAGPGPDALGQVLMNNQYDWLTLVCNGANWFIHSTDLPLVQNTFISGLSSYTPDLTKQVYFVSAFSGNVAFTLPNAHQPGSAGKEIVIKKADVSGNTITITEGNYSTFTGTGPDGQTIVLSNDFDWIRCVCNGANWFITAGNIFTKLGVQCSPAFNADFFGGGSSASAEQAQIARFGGGASPTAGNMYAIGLAKAGTDELYLGINKNTATNHIPSNAVFISTFGAASTMTLGRGNSGNNPSTNEIMITGASGAGVVTANGVETCIGVLKGANFNSTADQGVTISTANNLKYLITKILVTNASTSLTTAQGGFYTATSKGGTALVAAGQAYTALTGSTVVLTTTLTAAATLTTFALGVIYLSLTTAQGSAATGDVYIFGIPLT